MRFFWLGFVRVCRAVRCDKCNRLKDLFVRMRVGFGRVALQHVLLLLIPAYFVWLQCYLCIRNRVVSMDCDRLSIVLTIQEEEVALLTRSVRNAKLASSAVIRANM